MDTIRFKRDVARSAARTANDGSIEGTDTLSALSRIVELDPSVLERERILPPGAGGQNGGAYKMLRTQVLRRLDELRANSLAIIGAASGAGKTLTAINLAIAIAADLDRTALLVDLDLRKPSVHRRLGVTCKVGIEDCLRGGQPLKDAMTRLVGYERLVVLPARERCEDSSELLASKRTQDCIREMRERYKDRVIVCDLPPVLQADDALAFSRHVQAALLVVGDGRTQRNEVTRTLELFKDLPVLGTVLNGSREPVKSYY